MVQAVTLRDTGWSTGKQTGPLREESWTEVSDTFKKTVKVISEHYFIKIHIIMCF